MSPSPSSLVHIKREKKFGKVIAKVGVKCIYAREVTVFDHNNKIRFG